MNAQCLQKKQYYNKKRNIWIKLFFIFVVLTGFKKMKNIDIEELNFLFKLFYLSYFI